MDLQYDLDKVKRKVRKLKHLEITIRFNGKIQQKPSLVWETFFDLHDTPKGNGKYTLYALAAMDREEYKNVTEEYFALLYYTIYKENGMTIAKIYDPVALEQLNLPFHADETDIKKRFRELAKEYHPDTGGDPTKFIELMRIYKELTDK